MRVNANAVLRSWTLLAAFGGSYAPGNHLQFKLRYVHVHTIMSIHTSTEFRNHECLIIEIYFANGKPPMLQADWCDHTRA